MIRIWRGQHDGDGVARLTSRLQPLIGLQRERERERERGGRGRERCPSGGSFRECVRVRRHATLPCHAGSDHAWRLTPAGADGLRP